VAKGINLEVERGSKIAVLGENGQGKTTFLRTIAQDLTPKQGDYIWGSGTKIGYYAQHVLSMLHPEDDVYGHLKRKAASGVFHQDILNLAGSFLFRGDDVEKKISVLSGGERARLCLAGLLLSKSNILLLDEPTNHLDFETVEALGRALREYEGTVFFISHDRTFVNLIATGILDVKDGKIIRYPGTYEEYVYALETKAREEIQMEKEEETSSEILEQVEPEKKAEEKQEQGNQNISRPLNYLERKALKAEHKKLAKRLKNIEGQIHFYKTEKETIQKQFSEDPASWSRKLNDRLVLATKFLEEQESLWLELQQKLEELESRIGSP
jgi:ATP-binding cassette subfamily F protein 3